MKKLVEYILILLITIFLFILLKISFSFSDDKNSLFYVTQSIGNNEQIINPYFDEEENTYYFFLPSNYDKTNTSLILNKNVLLINEDNEIKGKTIISNIDFYNSYSIYSKDDNIGKIIFMHSKNIPSMYINVGKKDLTYLEKDKNNKSGCSISLLTEDGRIEYTGKTDSISGRGNSTWTRAKKGWSIELSTSSSLLGMNNSKNWVLLANAFDDTNGLRNYAAYNMALEVGLVSTSHMHFIDLYISNEYMGTYLLTEKIENNNERFPIGDLDDKNNKANNVILKESDLNKEKAFDFKGNLESSWADIANPSNFSGGYIIERNYGYKLEDKPFVFKTLMDENFIIRFPSVVSKEESEYISNTMQHVENALFSRDYVDKTTEKNLNELIDMDSWVLKYMIDEVVKNEGSGSTSSYFYKKENDELIYGGPIWDYDKAFGNYDIWQSPQGLTYNTLYKISPTHWYERLYYNEEANHLIKKYYKERFKPYLEELRRVLIDKWSEEINYSFDMNWCRWRREIKPLGNEWKENEDEFIGSLFNTKEQLKDWIYRRTCFLDSVWLDLK